MVEHYSTVGTTVMVGDKRFSWGAIFVGLFAALAAMVVLSVLGLAIGLSSVDAGDRPSNFGIGAGIWGGLSALVSFFFGGWISAWARPRDVASSGVLQGALMWMVALVLLVYVLAGGIGAVARTVGSAVSTGVQAAGAGSDAVMNDEQAKQDIKATTREATEDVKAKAAEVRQKITPQNVEKVAGTAAGGAWGTLASLLLTLCASAAGGYFGTKSNHTASRPVA